MRDKFITRTIESTNIDYVAVEFNDKGEMQAIRDGFSLPGTLDESQALKAVQDYCKSNGLPWTPVKVESVKHETELLGMSEREFLMRAKPINPNTHRPYSE